MSGALAPLEPVAIDAVELRRVALPLVTPFVTATDVEKVREVVVVRIAAGAHEGWGECVALSEPTYTAEYTSAAAAVLEHHLVPRLLAERRPLDAGGVLDALAPVRGHNMAKASLEMAMLDLLLRRDGMSLAAHLGATRARVDSGVSVGMFDDTDALVSAVASYLEAGFRRVKLKIAPGRDVEPVRAVRDAFGADLTLQVDANGSYAGGEADRVRLLDEFDLLLIEQPLADDDVCGHAALASRLRTPLCLDETITSPRVAADVIALGACSVVNIKAGRVGGLDAAREVHDVCVDAGAAAWCGGMLETGIGRACNLAIAALPGCTLTGDISPSSRFFERDIVTEPVAMSADGTMPVPAAPGIGVEIDRSFLAEVTVGSPVTMRR